MNDYVMNNDELREHYDDIVAELIDFDKAQSHQLGLFEEFISIMQAN